MKFTLFFSEILRQNAPLQKVRAMRKFPRRDRAAELPSAGHLDTPAVWPRKAWQTQARSGVEYDAKKVGWSLLHTCGQGEDPTEAQETCEE